MDETRHDTKHLQHVTEVNLFIYGTDVVFFK